LPVGGNKAKFSDFRIIAATNENLLNHVKIGKMREDFFYRIHIIPIHVPPLNERQEDIPLLIDHFLELYSTQKKRVKIPGKIMEILSHYNWPGNVRELQNALQRYIAVKKLDLLDSAAFWNKENNDDSRYYNEHGDKLLKELEKHNFNLRDAVKNYEKSIITQALDQAHWNRNKASEVLGVPLRTLSRKMKDYRLI
jgi:transcriptional regulator with PAS, ATPase and Fis domain